jgi:hypothetical protein
MSASIPCTCPHCPGHIAPSLPKNNEPLLKRVLAIVPKGRHAAWRKSFNKDYIEDNVNTILESCRDPLLDDSTAAERAKMADWDEFCKLVFLRLVEKGHLDYGTYINSCQDTAGGCDEIIWDAAVEVLKNNA